jgi:hypothetical protein
MRSILGSSKAQDTSQTARSMDGHSYSMLQVLSNHAAASYSFYQYIQTSSACTETTNSGIYFASSTCYLTCSRCSHAANQDDTVSQHYNCHNCSQLNPYTTSKSTSSP